MYRYRVVIADDEKFIRESLGKFVDWDALGFEIVQIVEDGKYVIDLLRVGKIDVVFCDIMMQEVSGLQVAEYISKHHLDCEVVLLSGYQDFDYAKTAITYSVSEYLLKPINVTKISETFRSLKSKLDQKREERLEQQRIKHQLQEFRHKMIENMIEMAKMGILRSRKDFAGYISGFGVEEEILDLYCSVFHIQTSPFVEYDTLAHDIIQNILLLLSHDYPFYDLFVRYEEADNYFFELLFLTKSEYSVKEGGDFRNNLKHTIKEICDVDVDIEQFRNDGSLEEYVMGLSRQSAIRHMGLQGQSSFYIESMAKHYLLVLSMTSDFTQVRDKLEQMYMEGDKYPEAIPVTDYMRHIMLKMVELLNEQYPNIDCSFEKNWEQTVINKNTFLESMKMIYTAVHQDDNLNFSMVDKVKQFLTEHVIENISLKDAADLVYLSPNYFCRLFKEQTGENYSEYFIRIKMEYAAKKLSDTRKKVYEISEELGYKNIKYFYKLFKRVYNCTPTEYRERL